jgi:hypothetical protein
MILPREEPTRPSNREHADPRDPQIPTTAELERMFRKIGRDLVSVLASVRRAAFLEVQRLHLKAVDGFFRGALYFCLLSAGVALSISVVLLLVSGGRGALVALSGNAWLADLLAGALGLAVLWAGALGIRAMLHASILRGVEKRMKAGRSNRSAAPTVGGME